MSISATEQMTTKLCPNFPLFDRMNNKPWVILLNHYSPQAQWISGRWTLTRYSPSLRRMIVKYSQLTLSSSSCIVKISQVENVLFIEQVWQNLTFNLQFALFDEFPFSHYQMSYLYVLCKEKLGVDNQLGLKGLPWLQKRSLDKTYRDSNSRSSVFSN